MKTMTVEPHEGTRSTVATDTRPESAAYTHPGAKYTRPAGALYRELETNPLVEEVLAWLALAGFAMACFFVFALAIWA